MTDETREPPSRPGSTARLQPDRLPHASPPRDPIASEVLFAGAREVQIRHGDALYRLKQTALGKLILTK